MTGAASDLDPAVVLPALTTRRLGRPYELLPSCASTNDEVAARATGGAAEGLLMAAERQTGGRGRRGRSWHSPPGENLYCSLLLRPALATRLATPLTLLVGAALAEALAALDMRPVLKWPNDLLLDTPDGQRKVAGILTEMASEGERVRHVVVGVGVNVNSSHFPDELAPIASSLRVACGHILGRGRLLAALVNAFEPIYDDFVKSGPGAGLARWRRHARLGQPCWVSRGDDRIAGVAADVDEAGALLLRTAGGDLVPIYAGEVSWR